MSFKNVGYDVRPDVLASLAHQQDSTMYLYIYIYIYIYTQRVRSSYAKQKQSFKNVG